MEQKTESQKLNDWLKTVSVGEYKNMITKIIEGCKTTQYTFNNWRYGLCRIPLLAQDKIEEIAGEKIFTKKEDVKQ